MEFSGFLSLSSDLQLVLCGLRAWGRQDDSRNDQAWYRAYSSAFRTIALLTNNFKSHLELMSYAISPNSPLMCWLAFHYFQKDWRALEQRINEPRLVYELMTGSDGRTIEFRRRFVLRRARFGLIGTVKRLLASKKLSHLPSLVLGVALDIKNFLFGSGF